MRWPFAYLTVPFLAVHCSAPANTTTFEEGVGGVSSGDATSATSGGSNAGGSSAATVGAGGSSGGNDVTVTANTSSSTSPGGGTGGSAGSTTGMSAGGSGGGADSTTSGTGGNGGTGANGGMGGVGTTAGSGATGGVGGLGTTGGSGGVGGSAAMGGTGGSDCIATEEVCDGEDNDCNESADEDDVCPEGCVGASFESHGYMFCDRPRFNQGGDDQPARSWDQAMLYCTLRDFNLALIESPEENAFIYKTLVRLNVSGDVWMGATDQDEEELWTWAVGESPNDWIPFYDQQEGEPIDEAFNDWREGEPNDDGGEDCGIFEDLGGDEWAWDDRDCEAEHDLFVCESLD